jgi:hypothetical protein
VLSNSYAFAYFFFGGDLFKGEFSEEQNERNKLLFEDSQEQLATEVSTCGRICRLLFVGLVLSAQRPAKATVSGVVVHHATTAWLVRALLIVWCVLLRLVCCASTGITQVNAQLAPCPHQHTERSCNPQVAVQGQPIPIRPPCVGFPVQVERLSGLLQKGQKLLEPSPAQAPKKQQQRQEMDADTLRQHTINSSVNIRQRIIKLFE